MILLEDVKRITEKATGWKRPDDPQAFLRGRKPRTYRFKDDGVIPNHPKWPLILYKSAVHLPESLDPAAVFEDLFESNGWGDSGATASTTMCTITRASMKCSASRAAQARFSSAGPKVARSS